MHEIRSLARRAADAVADPLHEAHVRLYTGLVLASIDPIARSYVETTVIDIKNWEPRGGLRALCDILGIAGANEARVAGASPSELEASFATVRSSARMRPTR
jgi:hypothetical protein